MIIISSVTRDRYLLCRSRSCFCAVPLQHLIETMRPLAVEPFGQNSEHVRGLAIVRGRPLPVVDTGALLGLQGEPASKRWVILRVGERAVAAEMEDIIGIREFPTDALTELPPLFRKDGDEIAHVGTVDSELLVVLRAFRAIPESLWQEIGQQGREA